MFTTFILAVHVLVCVALIMVILLPIRQKGPISGPYSVEGPAITLFGSTGATPSSASLTIAAADDLHGDLHHPDLFFRERCARKSTRLPGEYSYRSSSDRADSRA